MRVRLGKLLAGMALLALALASGLGPTGPAMADLDRVYPETPAERIQPPGVLPSRVAVEKGDEGGFRYLVNGRPQLFIGMGYNPIYRHLSDAERAARYDRDFRLLCQAGVNHITGWDADKGYEQDKFDELTLNLAHQYRLGVIMPLNLPPEGNYADEEFRRVLFDEAIAKVTRYRDHPALRMWGIGNEVLIEMADGRQRTSFGRFYFELVDLVHELDPNHPVIYREAEDVFVSAIGSALRRSDKERPWLLYGMNVYTGDQLERILADWPAYELDRPLFVTEFGAEPDWKGDRAQGYLAMWQTIRAYPDYVLGGAPYVWTTEGPEPVDAKWGLMDGHSLPVDDTFELLAEAWRAESGGRRCP